MENNKINIILGISISAAAIYLLNYNNVFKSVFIKKENKKDAFVQCNFTKKSIIEIKNSNVQCDLTNLNDNNNANKCDQNKDIDIIDKEELNESSNTKFCLLSYFNQ